MDLGRARALIIAVGCLAAGTGCASDGYLVVVRLSEEVPRADVYRIEVAIVSSCERQTASDVAGVVTRVDVTADGTVGELGAVAHGSYGLYARGISRACRIIAYGCVPIELEAGGEGALEVTMGPVSSPLCGGSETCTDSVCSPL